MNFQNNRYTLKFADTSDNKGICEVFESGNFQGGISVQYLRNPKPYESFCADGDDAKILIIIDNSCGMTVAVGGAVVRQEYLNGKPEKCAYLTGLKIHPDYQRKISFIPKAYDFLHQAIGDCKFCYTTVLDDNVSAISMFEKKHKNMPTYQYLGHYTTYCFHGGKKKIPIEKNNLVGFDELVNSYFSHLSLTSVDYHCAGLGEKNFYCVRQDDEIIACCFVGNQKMYKQYKMCSYGGFFKALSKIPTELFGYPEFPKSNSVVNHGVVSYLYVKKNEEKLCSDFLRTVAADGDYPLLIWGGFENNPLCEALNQMKTIHYGSRLYSVTWEQISEIHGTIGVEVALL